MELTDVWFLLIAVLWTGYFIFEGFDFGVGILLPVLGRTEPERRVLVNTIGPVWDGNEVWVLVAGGATFAAFPEWYATLFSGFYLPLLLILVALIIRGVAFEYRSKVDSLEWRRRWDAAIFFGSLIPAILWGVAFGNIIRGVPIDAQHEYAGNFFTLLNPYSLLGGLTTLTLFTLLATATLFLALYPDVMPSSLDAAFSLTVDNASSTPYTLKIMTWVAVVFTPIVPAYQAWTYWVFRKRIGVEHIPESPGLPSQRRPLGAMKR